MATITNSICTSNIEIDIQSGTGNLNVGSIGSAKTITIGTTANAISDTINIGNAGTSSSTTVNVCTTQTTGSWNFSIGNNNSSNAGNIYMYGSSINATTFQSGAIITLSSGYTQFSTAGGGSLYIDGTTGQVQITCPTDSTKFSSSIRTAPLSSHIATSQFGTTTLTAGTSVQNGANYNVLCNICVSVTSATAATITLGVGSTSTPTVDTVISTFTVAAASTYTFSAIVPVVYYLLVNTTGTIVVGSITVQSCPM